MLTYPQCPTRTVHRCLWGVESRMLFLWAPIFKTEIYQIVNISVRLSMNRVELVTEAAVDAICQGGSGCCAHGELRLIYFVPIFVVMHKPALWCNRIFDRSCPHKLAFNQADHVAGLARKELIQCADCVFGKMLSENPAASSSHGSCVRDGALMIHVMSTQCALTFKDFLADLKIEPKC